MRVQNGVYRHLQSPSTIFGMPPLFAAFALGGVFFVGAILTLVIDPPLVMLLCIFSIPPALAFTIALRRKDAHCEATLLLPHTFFKGKQARCLIVGGSLKTTTKGKTK
ncbi:hypothetical protein PsAD2_01461 [Pseudovibrio axinellae]|uniref:Type IV secretory pathway, VirB3-like protein n=1 Tax=Pseudovibrio axinellae TaxID=989403 RepID=A0A165ZZ13_9HYPH|nr:hypothetical protein [Pseudovibrio axinellae]KZL20418.1 hypothetical protein PsAD2_01461 [Pseudovibrio axinellae]SER77638.1 hypothetical protein SAMN05421798_12219 [Pseudovibrio axinellae]